MIEIKNISAEETYAVRLEVLRKNIDLPYKFNGDLDTDTFHLGAFNKGELIAISSFMNVKNNHFKGTQYQLRGMATLEQYQGFGIGKLLIMEAEKILNSLNVDCLWCNARIIAVDFYKKQGFRTFEEKFNIPLIGDHFVMYKYLK